MTDHGDTIIGVAVPLNQVCTKALSPFLAFRPGFQGPVPPAVITQTIGQFKVREPVFEVCPVFSGPAYQPAGFPVKYICAGRIIPLGKAGRFRLTYVYETTPADKDWTFTAKDPDASSVDLLWIGRASSEPVELSIQ